MIRRHTLFLLALLLPRQGVAQRVVADTAPPAVRDSAARGEVVGTVLDAESAVPLPGAVVHLELRPGGAMAPVSGRSAFWASGLTTTTDYTGGYRFTRIPPGTYRLVVRRLGYRPATLDLELRREIPLRVSVGLVVHPILLEPETVVAPATLFTSTASYVDAGTRRLDAERYRQRTFLESDVQVLTHSDVTEAVTLGETDLFRALQRLPGVTTRDDYTAELWTRGAPWSQTRVYFDGLPLFNPLHTAGVFSGVNPDAVGAAFFHPGVRGAALGEGAAGVVELTSRAGTGPDVGGAAELSVVSGRLALDGGFGGERGGWMVAGRRSYIDLLTAAFADSSNQVPYALLDLAGRVDLPVGRTSTLEVSGLWERDDVRGDVRNLLKGNDGNWGNGVARATFAAPLGGLYTRQTVGLSRYGQRVGVAVFGGTREGVAPSADLGAFRNLPVTQEPTDNRITFVTVRGSVEPLAGPAWRAGYEVQVQDQWYFGPTPRPYPVAFFSDTLAFSERRVRGAMWGERRMAWGPLTVRAGLRLEAGAPVANAGAIVAAPRVSARLAPSARAALTLGFGRSYQYTQAVAPAGPGLGPELHVTDAWLMANDSLPALRADIGTFGGEVWLGETWLGTVNFYARYATGVTVPEPGAGPVSSTRRIFVSATNRALGFEVSVRRLAGRITGSASYSNGSSRLKFGTLRYAAPTERRHALDVTAMWLARPSLRLGAAFTASAGARFTRHFLEALPCDTLAVACADSVLVNTIRVGGPSEGRAPAYVTADLLADWSHAFSGWTLGVFLQLRNVVNRRGAVTYSGSFTSCPSGERDVRSPEPDVCDLYERGLPFLPLLGVSVRF